MKQNKETKKEQSVRQENIHESVIYWEPSEAILRKGKRSTGSVAAMKQAEQVTSPN